MLLHLAIAQLWRQRHNPELRIMAIALFLAVFSVTTLTNLTAAFRLTMGQDAATLLGADLIIESSEPLSVEYKNFAQSSNLQTCMAIDFFSMISVKGSLQLASIYAIDSHFPLRGQLMVKTVNTVSQYGPPPQGEIWMDDNLALRLKVNLGDKVAIGDAAFVLGGIIQQRPVALSDSSALAPVAYVNAQDLAKMDVLQPGSRATYRLMLEGSPEQIRLMIEHYQGHASNVSLITPVTGRQGSGFNRVLTTANQYLAVILLVQSLLAGIAVAICAHQYTIRQQKNVALIRCFGASSKTILQLQIVSLLILATFILALSISAGYLVTHVLLLYSQQLGFSLSVPFWQGGIFGALSGVLILIGFALGPILDLKRVSPMQVLQQQNQSPSKASMASYILAVLALGLLFTTTLDDSALAIRMGSQIIGLSLVVFAISYGLWIILARLSTIGPLSWRFGMAYLIRYKWKSITQWLVFTIVIMLLLLVQIIQRNFIKAWQEQLPLATPNYFLINIQPNQILDLEKWFKSKDIKNIQFYPIVRGRMSHINGMSIDSINKESNDRKGLGRPINLTWMAELPADNKVIAGMDWHNVAKGLALISIEKNFAERQGLTLGDSIGFQIGERSVSAKIVQVRTVEWQSFKPNFFVIFPPNVIDEYPHSYITSFYLPSSQKEILIDLAKEYVEISIIDIDALLQKVRQMIDKISLSLQVLLMMVFVLGLLIMYASLLSSLKERLQESALLQILGANKRFIAKVLSIEFCALGLMSGLFASVFAQIIAFDLAEHFFGFPYVFDYKWLFIGIISSTVVILVFGLMGARKIFYISPLWLLRNTA